MKKRVWSLILTLALVLALGVPALGAGCPVCVDYNLGGGGVSADLTSESVAVDAKPRAVPEVLALGGKEFKGWSLTDPKTLKAGQTPTLVDPTTVRVTGDTTFYAVYGDAEVNFHEHYVIGYPGGTFNPNGFVTRAEVATIIARAILPDFVEGSSYGNPGGYSDVAAHWAESAIAYCTKYGVVQGYDDGTYKPNQYITREELALAVANLDGVLTNVGEMPFVDIDEASDWALPGIWTAYTKGWIRGDADTNTYRPRAYITRAETVTLFNAYLHRGVDAAGLSGMTEYVHTGVASNNTEDGADEYMTWADVPKTHWAYYEIIEAANDHEFLYTGEDGKSLPEKWTKCWIDEKWRYHDDLNDTGNG